MKGLIKNYIDLLSIDKLKGFALKNDINLNEEQLEYILNLTKNSWEDILINDNKYFKLLQDKIDQSNLDKIRELFLYYKNRYKGYLI